MILIVCTDDPALDAIARTSARNHPAVFGSVHKVFREVPPLGRDEALFIIAHGSYHGDDNNPVIGDRRAAFYVNAVELYLNIQSILPDDYRASVYIDACEAAEHDDNTFSFAEVFKAQIQRDHDVRVFARNGIANGLIPLPASPGWIEAELAPEVRAQGAIAKPS